MRTDQFYQDIRRFEAQRVWKDIKRDVLLMVLCAGALGFLVGQWLN